jgi:hypothetical protein
MGNIMRYLATASLGGAFLAVALAAGGSPALADPVGLVQRLQNTVYGTVPQAGRVPKHQRDGIEFDEVIQTAKNSAVEIGFVDGTNLTIGAEANVTIDAFVFDTDSSAGMAALTLGRGAFRWITGLMPADAVTIETPTATITIRGTNVKIGVRANGDTLLGLDDGEVKIVSKGKGDPVTLQGGQGARVTPEGIQVFDEVPLVADAVIDDGWLNAIGIDDNRDHSGSRGSSGGSGNN